MPEYAKDVMLAILGASVGLAGLLLVFSGFVFGQASGAPSLTTSDKKIAKYKRVGRAGLWPFLGAIANSLTVVIWLIWPHETLYFGVLSLFTLLLVSTAVYGGFITLHDW